MAYEVVMPYHLHMPSYFLETFTEYPYLVWFETDFCQYFATYNIEYPCTSRSGE